MDIRNIYNGWKNVFITDDNIEAVAKVRLQICGECPSKINQLGLDVCGECHCPLIAKTRSKEEECPLKKW